MAIPAESRDTVRHLLNIRLPYSYENPDFRLINEGVSDLTENYEAETDDVQYICEKAKTTNIKGISRSFDLSMKYIQDDPIQNWMNLVFRKPLTGSKSRCDYIRLNILEPMFGTINKYIAVRSKATVQPVSIGGAASDPMTTAVKINASGDPVIGFVEIDNTVKDNPKFIWHDADLDIPIITSPISKSSITGTTVTVQGTGIALHYVVVYYGTKDTDKTPITQIKMDGTWEVTIDTNKLGKNAKIAAVQYDKEDMTGKQSVSSIPVSFTTPISVPTITTPTDNATNVAKNSKIKGTGIVGATVTVQTSDGTLGQGVVDNSGNWEITPTPALTANKTYTINAKQRTLDGESAPCESISFTTSAS